MSGSMTRWFGRVAAAGVLAGLVACGGGDDDGDGEHDAAPIEELDGGGGGAPLDAGALCVASDERCASADDTCCEAGETCFRRTESGSPYCGTKRETGRTCQIHEQCASGFCQPDGYCGA